MTTRMRDLYRAIERNEDHSATISTLLSHLKAEYKRARGDHTERARIERDIAYYIAKRAELHAERDMLRTEVMNHRRGGCR